MRRNTNIYIIKSVLKKRTNALRYNNCDEVQDDLKRENERSVLF